ncbi:Cerato-ulmin hydrophobin family [Xylariomycetidae sp. FL0641]|nr:Cerato-ulmin hydrophobin family [Xylariomycetidae sp. FL0641]
MFVIVDSAGLSPRPSHVDWGIVLAILQSHKPNDEPPQAFSTQTINTIKMQFTTIVSALFAGMAAAGPLSARQYTPCSGLYGTAQCCATDVLGVADLDCANPPTSPTSAQNFTDTCSEIGQRARCCVLPILEQGILCQTPTGVQD